MWKVIWRSLGFWSSLASVLLYLSNSLLLFLMSLPKTHSDLLLALSAPSMFISLFESLRILGLLPFSGGHPHGPRDEVYLTPLEPGGLIRPHRGLPQQ